MAVSNEYNPPQDPLVILHHDAELLAVNKPAGLLSVPGRGEHLADCLISRIQAAFPEALLVHRLDRDTSGVMVFGLTPHAQRHLSMQFEKAQREESLCGAGCWQAGAAQRHRRPAADRRLAEPAQADGLP